MPNDFKQPIQARGVVLRTAESGRVITFRASTPAVDTYGTSIRPEGIRTERYDSNPIFLWAHDGYGSMFGGGPSVDSVIGRVVGYERNAEAFDIDVEFATEEMNPKAEQAYRLAKGGFLNAVSIGFRVMKWHVEEREGGEIYVLDEVELLEVSLVPIPSNPEAVALVRSMAGQLATPPAPTPTPEPPAPEPSPPTRDTNAEAFGAALTGTVTQLRLTRELTSALRGVFGG